MLLHFNPLQALTHTPRLIGYNYVDSIAGMKHLSECQEQTSTVFHPLTVIYEKLVMLFFHELKPVFGVQFTIGLDFFIWMIRSSWELANHAT